MEKIVKYLVALFLCISIINVNVNDVHAVSGFKEYFTPVKSEGNYFDVGDKEITFHMTKSMISKLKVGDTVYIGFTNGKGNTESDKWHYDFWHYTIDEDDMNDMKSKSIFKVQVTPDFITYVKDVDSWAAANNQYYNTAIYMYSKDVYDSMNINFTIYNRQCDSYISIQSYYIGQTPYVSKSYSDIYKFSIDGTTLKMVEWAPRPKVDINVGEEYALFLEYGKGNGEHDFYYIKHHKLTQNDVDAIHTATNYVSIDIGEDVANILNAIPKDQWKQIDSELGYSLYLGSDHSVKVWSLVYKYDFLGTIYDLSENLEIDDSKDMPVVDTDSSKEDAESSDTTPSTLDLSAYSAMNMNVYQNSRVTSMKANSNGTLTLSGYMFNDANCNKPNSLYREIIFVDANDTSISKAYRQEVKSKYNTFLNKNMNATQNGKYDLSYACYDVTVNPKAMLNYAKTSTASMAKGEYLAYMRVSDGKTSYLFPLKDAVLSDGSTMEASGTLPRGFKVNDTKERTLSYIVE